MEHSYQPDLPAIVAHAEQCSTLEQMAQSGNLPHAILLYGAKGVGKRLVAETLARHVICGKEEEGAPLSYNTKSHLFPQITALSCPDLHYIEPEEGKKSISVEQIRDKLQLLSLTADGKRIVIVDSADDMTKGAANALLKMLEEPNDHIYFVLISHNLSKLLPTIISRCRKFRFGRLNAEQTQQVLSSQLPEATQEEITTLLNLAEGCPGIALNHADDMTEISTLLDGVLSGTPPKTQLTETCEKLARGGKASMTLNILLTKLAKIAKNNPQTSSIAEVYSRSHAKLQQMEEFNITPQLILETTLQDVVSSIPR